MVRWTRCARIKYGAFVQAIQWAKEITKYVNEKYKIQLSVYMDSFGDFGTIRWFCDYADLATMEKVGRQLFADAEYLQKVNKGADWLIPGSVVDTVMRAMAV